MTAKQVLRNREGRNDGTLFQIVQNQRQTTDQKPDSLKHLRSDACADWVPGGKDVISLSILVAEAKTLFAQGWTKVRRFGAP